LIVIEAGNGQSLPQVEFNPQSACDFLQRAFDSQWNRRETKPPSAATRKHGSVNLADAQRGDDHVG
jgi:hypothetical protein